MKHLSVLATLLCSVALSAQTISYKGARIELGPHAILVDANSTLDSPYVFRSFNEAMGHLSDGTPADPMKVYLAPWVYWVDDPDDPRVRRPGNGAGVPIGLTIRCESLQLLGMCEDPRDVVLASARGQSQGSIGNFTMFDIYGNDLVVKDLTMGNYCNIDLEYPRNPKLNRARRGPAITQAQLAFVHGDRIYAENVRFMARLNLTPLSGGRRTLFTGCHFELTDDSMAHSGVYVSCSADFYGRQPFGSVDRYGSIWMDCDLNICHSEPVQAMSKSVGRHTLVDDRFHSGRKVCLAWTFRPEEWLRCYQYNVTLDGIPVLTGAAKPYNTVVLDQTAQLWGLRLIRDDGSVLYNTYNILRGDDDWDPQGIKDEVLAIGKRDGRDYTNIPVCLDLDMRTASVQTGSAPVTINAVTTRQTGFVLEGQKIYWKVQPGYEKFVKLSGTEGPSCTVTAYNHEDKTQNFNLFAYTTDGLQGAVALTVVPDFVEAPAFVSNPRLSVEDGIAKVEYALDLRGRTDESLITWYRCTGRKGEGAVPVAVSRCNRPKQEYRIQPGDNGKYIAAGVAPKHLRCNAGQEVLAVSQKTVRFPQKTGGSSGTPAGWNGPENFYTEFYDFPTSNQTEVKPGCWTVDAFKPADTKDYDWKVDPALPCWTWGKGINGASQGYGLQQLQQGARLMYTPVSGKYSDMFVKWKVDPAKDGGQGFASARMQYLDLFVKFDTKTLTGYALRAIRTTKYANAVDIMLVRYDNGSVTTICEPVTVDCFLTGCEMTVRVEGNRISAKVEGPGRIKELAGDKKVQHSATLGADIVPNSFGGIGLQHTSTVGAESRILIRSVEVGWR